MRTGGEAPHRFTRQWTPIAAIALVLVAGCTSNPNESQPTPAPTVSPPARSVQSSPADPMAVAVAERDASAVYSRMWQAYADAGRTTSPQYAELARYADGDALAALRAGLDGNRREGLITKGDLVPHPTVTALTPAGKPDTASIRDCLDTSRATLVKASPGGAPFSDAPGGRRLVTATVKNLNGTWKVISFVPLDVGTC